MDAVSDVRYLWHEVQDLLSRFVAALGGTLKLIADFGDEQLKLA
jgi:hypothetical protein